MLRRLFIFALLLWLACVATAQTFNRSDYYFGDSTHTLNTICNAIRLDSIIYLAVDIVDSLHDPKLTLVKIDSYGNVLDKRIIGRPEFLLSTYYGESMIMDRDSFFLVCCWRQDDSTGASDGYVVKFDRNLDTLWTRVYDIPTSLAGCPANLNPMNYFSVIRQCPDGNYIIGCNFNKECIPANRRSALCKIDTTGNVLWWKVYPNYNEIYDIEIAPDSGFFLPEAFGNQLHVVKTDSLGNVQWTVQVNHQNLPHHVPNIELVDSIYLIAASKHWRDNTYKNSSLVVARVNTSTRQVEWEKVYHIHSSFVSTDLHQSFSMEVDSSANIIIAGTARNDSIETYLGILLKLNGQGDSLWSRYYEIRGTRDIHQFNDLVLMPDGGYILVGTHLPEDHSYNFGAWMVRTDSMGWAPGSQSVGIKEPVNSEGYLAFHIFPNPASDYTEIRFGNPVSGKLRIHDMLGKEVFSTLLRNEQQLRISVGQLHSGNYILSFRSEDGITSSGKMLMIVDW